MSKLKVYEMARKVGMSNKDFLMKLQEWGIEVKSHLNVLEDDDVKKIQDKLNSGKPKKEKASKPTEQKTQEKKNEKKKDEPRIIRREIIQVREDIVEEKTNIHPNLEYDLKPRKAANPEQFRRSEAQIEKKNTPIPSIMDLFKPKEAIKKEEPKKEVKAPDENTVIKKAETSKNEVENKSEVKPNSEKIVSKQPVNKPNNQQANRPNTQKSQDNNRQAGNRPQGNWQNKNNNNGNNKYQGNRSQFNRNGNKPQGMENQLKQAFKDSPVVENVTKEPGRQFKQKPQVSNNDNQERRPTKGPKSNAHIGNFNREHLKELRAGHSVNELLNDDDSVLMNYYDLDRRNKNGGKKKKEEPKHFEQPNNFHLVLQ